jgi:hypothetical protein
MPPSEERLALMIATARTNPEFARRLVQNLPESTRVEVLARLALPPKPATKSLSGPGLAKCQSRPRVNNGLSAQLNQFAKAVSRVS